MIIQEDIRYGEPVRKYAVEARVGGEWRTVCEGESIGHKHIQSFDAVECSKVRLTIEASIAEPRIKDFSVFYVK